MDPTDRATRLRTGHVAALAGRRIDAESADSARFPAAAAPAVKSALATLLVEREIHTLVCSAACGADILALEAADQLGVRTRIILPFDAPRFRNTSVVDRGASWGSRYDAVLATAAARGDVVVHAGSGGDDDAAYEQATRRIIEETVALARTQTTGSGFAIAVWDGVPRATGDATQDFVERAAAAGLLPLFISTLT